MLYIIRMSRNWKDILEDKENIVFLKEDVKENTIEIEVEDIDNFTSKNNFHIEYEILMPGLIKLGLNTVGVIVWPNYRNEEAEDLMRKMLMRKRKYGISMEMDIQNYDDIAEKYLTKYLTNNKLIKLVEKALDKSVKNLNQEQLESLMKIINGELDNSRKMFWIGEVFEGKVVNFFVPEGEEYKSIFSTIEGTTLNIKNPMDEFHSDLGKKEMPSVSVLINEIKKVDTPEAIRLVKNLEENTLKEEEIKLIQELSKSVDWFVQTANIARKKEFKIKIEKTIDDLSDEQLIELLPKIDLYIDRLSRATLDYYQISKYENLIKIIKKRLSLSNVYKCK